MNDAISRAAALAVVEKMYKLCEGNLWDYKMPRPEPLKGGKE